MSEAALELRNVSKRYVMGKGIVVDALRGVNLVVRKGEIVAIMGPSGSGKSTLLNIAGTLDRPTSGRVIIEGVDVTDMSEDELSQIRCERIGFVFQMFNLVSNLTALENVMLPMLLSGRFTPGEARERALELLRLVGMARFAHHRPPELSGGQQQRVAIARALANDPAIIMMDEPTGSVDLESAARILALVRWLNRALGYTFMIVTHDPEVAMIADRILYIRGGRLYDRPPGDLLSRRLEELVERERVEEIRDAYLNIMRVELRSLIRRAEAGELGRAEYLSELARIRARLRGVLGGRSSVGARHDDPAADRGRAG